MNPDVHIYRYVTEKSFDSYLWQTIENKQRFISQIMSSKSPVRACDDVDETALSYAEIKALCAGDPRIKEKMDLDIEVAKLRLMKADYQSNQFKLEDQILKQYPEEIRQAQERAKGYRADMALLEAHPLPKDGFVGMAIKGKRIADKEAAGKMLLEACRLSPHDMELGEYRGMKMTVDYDSYRQEVKLVLRGEMSHTVTMGTDVYGNLTRIENALANMPQKLEKAEERIAELERQTEQAKAELGKPFAQEKELEAKAARLAELNAALNIDEKRKEPMEKRPMKDVLKAYQERARRSESGRKGRNKRMEPMKNIPVYRHSAAYAVEHGELEAYKTSRVAGVACRDAIEKAVAGGGAERKIRAAGGAERRTEHRRPDAHGTGGGECGGETPLRPRQAESALRPRRWGKEKISRTGGTMNMNEALQQSLYDKLSREQDKYRDWLKGQPPEEILHHSYEYTVREDILMSMEELTLSEAETRALLLSPSPMAILYDKFSDLETGYMDTIRDSIEDTAKDEAKKLRDLPVYPYPADHAREQGELDVYRASFRANVSCKDAIEAAIRDNYHDNRLDTAAVGQVAEQFGQERMLYVLAATVRHFDYDGRISRDNKRWANTIPVYENKDGMDSDRSVQFVVSSHPGLTDLFLTQARHEQRLRQPLTADEIKAEAARLLGKLQEPVQPNSPGGTHFMAEVSRDFMERAGAKDTAALQKLLPFSTLALTTLKDRRGVFALIGKDEDRSQSLRRPSVRSKLQQASAEQKQPAAKKKDLEL